MNLKPKMAAIIGSSAGRGYHLDRGRSWRRAFVTMLAVLSFRSLFDPSVRAEQITLQMDIHQAGSADGGNLSYYAFAFLSSTSTPITYDEVYSWNTNYQFVGGIGAGSATYGLGFGSLGDMMNAFTNGLWKLVRNVGDPSQKTYYFSMSAPNFKTNTFPAVHVLSPTNGAVNVINNPICTWTGTHDYPEVDVNESGSYQNFYQSATLPPATTNWNPGQTLNQGVFSFDVTYFNSNSPAVLLVTTPTNSLGQSPPGWRTVNRLFADDSATFTVGAVDPSGTPHTLVAHYTWDGTNADGSTAGVDVSGNGYNMNFASGFGTQGGANSTTVAASGPRAIQFRNGDGNSAGFVGWNPTPSGLLSALAGSFTVSCWMKTTQSGFGWDQAPAYYGAGIVSADNSGLANDVIPLSLTGNKIGFNTGGSLEDDTVNSATSVNDGNYHHVAVTRNQLTGQKIIYIDGVLDSFSSGTTNLLNDPLLITFGALSDASQSDASAASYANGFEGELDDVQIYSGVLSSNEVANLHGNPGSTVANGGGSGGHQNVAHYAFDNGLNLGQDSSPNGNDMSGPTVWGPTYQSSTNAEAGAGAVQFFGTSALYAQGQTLTHLNAVLTGSFTFSTWVRTPVSNGADYNNALFGATIFWAYNDQGNTNDTIPLSITGSKATFTTRDHLGNNDTLHSLTSVNDGNYHLITVTRDQATGEKKIYVDGNFETSDLGTTDHLNGDNYRLTIGGWANCTDGNCTNFYAYNGLLDDLQVYRGVLSDAEVASLYANPGMTVPDVAGGSGGPVAHYDFDEGTVVAPDVSGNFNPMVQAGNFGGSGPSISADTAAGAGSVSFDGGSYLSAPSSLLSTLAGEFTVSLWLRTSQNFGSQNALAWQGAGVVSADSPNSGARDLIPVALTGGQVAFNIGDGNSDNTLNSSGTVNDDRWHQVVVTRSQSTGTRQIFIDGTLDSADVASTVLLNSPALLTFGAKADATNPDPSSPDATGANGYQGLLDDVQIYNRVISGTDISYLYNHPGATITSGGVPGLNVTASPLTGRAPLTVQFTSPSGDSVGNTLTNWQWGFGDGGTSSAQSPSHTYNTAGSFLPTLIAYSTDGTTPLSVTGLGAITVTNLPDTAPIVTLNPFNQTNYPGYNVALLADAAAIPAPSWQWFKIGSGLVAGATNKLYIPANSGTAGAAGSYFAVASNRVGTANTTTAAVSFVNAPLPPNWTVACKTQLSNNAADSTTNYNIACLLDATGTNLYTVGSIIGTNFFGADRLTTQNGGSESVFLKQTTAGTAIWGRAFTNNGNGSSYAECMAAAPGGGIYASGDFFGTNWLGTNKLVDVAGGSTYLARFDADGNALWIQTITGTNGNFTEYHDLTSDPAGNVTLSTLISGDTRVGTSNVFVLGQRGVLAQFDANGNLRWLQLPSGWPTSLSYNGGCIYGSMGGGQTNYIGGASNLSDRREVIFSINATNGQGNWLRGVAGQANQGNPYGFVDDEPLVAVSGNNVFVAGTAWGSNAVFGAHTVTFPGSKGEYLARYDINGNAQLATTFGSEFTWPWSMQADASGNVYIGSDFDTYSVFGNDIIAARFYETVQSLGSLAAGAYIPGQTCVAKFDRDGNPLWARLAESGSSYLNARDIALAVDGVWSCGFFNQQSVFGAITINGALTCIGTPICTPQYHPSGYLAKITESAGTASPVTLFNPQDNGVNFRFQFLSQAGFNHSILYRTNLDAGNWQTNSTIAGDGTVKTISSPLSIFGPSQQGFIRVSTQ